MRQFMTAMGRSHSSRLARTVLLLTAVTIPLIADADFDLVAPDGRTVHLRDDGTWTYLDEPSNGKIDQAVLSLERKTARPNGCGFAVHLTNSLTYEINTFVPYYAVYRKDGVLYETVSSPVSFSALKPGNEQTREFEVQGLQCIDIGRIQVVGGERCEMGTLTRYSREKGACLARFRVQASDLVTFEK
jgi:hypothetical protein